MRFAFHGLLTNDLLLLDCHNNDALDIAFSGAVATVAHVDGIHVHVACCGDVQAVLGCLEVSERRSTFM